MDLTSSLHVAIYSNVVAKEVKRILRSSGPGKENEPSSQYSDTRPLKHNQLKLKMARVSEKYKDSFRKPEKLLEFAGLESHHKVLDVCTGFGYLARHIALKTKKSVDAQNGSEWRPFFESIGIASAVEEMEERYGIRHVFATMEDPALSQVGTYHLITMQNCFHDLYDMPVDRRKFFRSIRRALKPGGKFLLVDHRAPRGRGALDAGANRGLHRIEECVAREELIANGFMITKTSDMFCSNVDNHRSSAWTDPMRETDRFVILCEEAI